MHPRHPESPEYAHQIDLQDVPDWRRTPASGVWEFGKKLETVTVANRQEIAAVTPKIREIRTHLEKNQTEKFFGGPLANVEHIALSDNEIRLETSSTDFFTYLSAAYAYREHQGDNPIRPLAAQATLFSPDGSRMIIERRPEMLADNPGKLSVFGSGLKPGANPNEAILEALNFKLHLDLLPAQIRPSGLVRDNINNIYCITYSVRLDEEQFSTGRQRATTANRSGERMFYQVSTDETKRSIERLFGGKRPISEWDPNAYYNILYALASEAKRSPEELQLLVEQTDAYMQTHPMEYTYPMEKYLPPDPNVL